MQRTPSRPSRARGSLFWKISLLLDQKEGVTTGNAQMGLKKWLTNLIHGQVHSAVSQTLGHILKTCKRTWVYVGHHLTLEVCNIHALTLRWGVWGQYRNFFLATDMWLTQSVGLSVGTIIDSGLGFDCISSSFREGARTTHYWGGSILKGKVGLLTREYACCVLEGNRELLNVAVRSCRNAIKMISAQHSSNNGKNWQKLSYQKSLLAW